MFCYEYRCDVCDYSGFASWGSPGYYVFSDGERMPVVTQPVWCNTCSTITQAEQIPPVTSLTGRIQQLHSRALSDEELQFIAYLNESLEEHIQSCINTCNLMIARFKDRHIPNRCIECGGHDFMGLETDEGVMPDAFPHQKCTGMIRQRSNGHGSPSDYFLLDPQGNRIHTT